MVDDAIVICRIDKMAHVRTIFDFYIRLFFKIALLYALATVKLVSNGNPDVNTVIYEFSSKMHAIVSYFNISRECTHL